jgi:polyhydroxyalkanoate synthase
VLYVGPDAWFAKNTPEPGSWWPAWKTWLEEKSSGVTPAPSIGAPDKCLLPIVPAPGTYVHQT